MNDDDDDDDDDDIDDVRMALSLLLPLLLPLQSPFERDIDVGRMGASPWWMMLPLLFLFAATMMFDRWLAMVLLSRSIISLGVVNDAVVCWDACVY